MEWIKDNWVNILAVWGGICVIVDTIVAMTSTKKDDEIWAKTKSILQQIFWVKKN